MKRLVVFSILVFISLIPLITSCKQKKMNEKMRTALFDDNWRFIKENPSGAENPSFDDSKWRTIDLPHDWSIEDLPGQTGDSVIGLFSRAASGKMGTGYTVGGTAWYRKSLVIDWADRGKKACLQFSLI